MSRFNGEAGGPSDPSGRRRLTKSYDRKIGGVAGGLADYFDIDPTLVRVLWVVACFVGPLGFGAVVAYFVMWFIIPDPQGDPPPPDARDGGGGGMDPTLLLGIVILGVGGLLLLRATWWWMPRFPWHFPVFWPVVLILLGAFIVYSARRRD